MLLIKPASPIEVATNEQQLRKIDELDKEIEKKKAEIAEYSENISQGFDQPPLLVYLEDTVNNHAQKMMFSFGRIKQVGQMNICPVTVTMISSYDGLKKILEDLSSGEFIIRVTDLNAMQAVNLFVTAAPEVVEPVVGEDGEIDLVTQPEPETQSITDAIGIDDPLDVTLTLEVYSIAGEIPEDMVYEFDTSELTYGGDIFY